MTKTLHKRTFLSLFCIALINFASSRALAQGILSDISVNQEGARWTICSMHAVLTLDENTLNLQITWAGTKWQMNSLGNTDLQVGLKEERIWLSVLNAQTKKIEKYETGFKRGVKITLTDFMVEDRKLDFSLSLFICLEAPLEEFVFTAIPKENEVKIKRLNWPSGFAEDGIDFTVVPFMQGMLLPHDWPKKVWLYDNISFGRGLYMPWWGQLKDKHGYMSILETPADGGCNFEHPAGGPTRISPMWVHSLGGLSYPRSIRYVFFDSCSYVTMAKRYRKYVQETGKFVSLQEKVSRTPNLQKLIGSPLVHTSILYHIQPQSSYFHKDDPAKNHQLVTFAERAEHLKTLKQQGVEQAYVHLDGWGLRGYDNLHPDILPPCPEAGGWEGMKYFAKVCDSLGYVFALHDQYRDYYLDAASYDPRHTIINEHGERPSHSIWYGGEQSILCASLAPGYVQRNYNEIFARGIKVKGAYLDVFAVVTPEECYNEEHPMTRLECMEYRAQCFSFIRSNSGIVSSEEPVDWAIPHIDLVHHGPYALVPNPGKGPAMGIPIPLFSLVYHDALFLPWSLGRGAWGVPEADLGFLHALLNAGMPYVSIKPDEDELDRVREACALHQRVALLEMTDHQFLDGTYRKQKSVFSDGTEVVVELDADTYTINSRD